MTLTLDLNADVGEGFEHDKALLGIVTSANVACGFHAGDASTMRLTSALAVHHGVAIGAQPSYRDREGFGRRDVEIDPDRLVADLVEQVDALMEAAASVGGVVTYLKPHGALYNRAGVDAEHAAAVVEACRRYELPVLALPGSRLLSLADEAQVRGYREFFADRAYADDGRLVPRSHPDAVITDPDLLSSRVHAMAQRGDVDSVCVHGDTDGAVELARAARVAIESAGVEVRAFA